MVAGVIQVKVIIDADACPVTDIAVALCRQYRISCHLFCDTAHMISREGAQTVTVDKGADSADYAIVRQVMPGDVVITQDYGLAAMCLAKQARVLHQNGWEYTADNIDALLWERHEAKKFRKGGGRTKGPSKRTAQQDLQFHSALDRLLQKMSQG